MSNLARVLRHQSSFLSYSFSWLRRHQRLSLRSLRGPRAVPQLFVPSSVQAALRKFNDTRSTRPRAFLHADFDCLGIASRRSNTSNLLHPAWGRHSSAHSGLASDRVAIAMDATRILLERQAVPTQNVADEFLDLLQDPFSASVCRPGAWLLYS